ncbi:DUF2239 family protein [Allopontixanthobacter sp.]|uniref:DUF2239 family protein n=1 Tax=Allopontixanthobacter sp. TaxID=2906452 RepID=UPI002ABCB8DE|nr:DUF2239 family protein [Allopontixanthobacter sp.]MDZ4308785.1 DUF2239 family protein [Allopontixanthobacter sp.]
MARFIIGLEEVIRALFAGEGEAFAGRMAAWPPDIQDHALALSQPSPSEERS